jgi:hypothetical protein
MKLLGRKIRGGGVKNMRCDRLECIETKSEGAEDNSTVRM